MYWVLLIKKSDYFFAPNVKEHKCNEYLQFQILEDYVCVLLDNSKWVDTPELPDFIFETNYLRTFLFKQHGFFAETSQ